MLVNLQVDYLWKGVLYERGEREIPDELAEALQAKRPDIATPVESEDEGKTKSKRTKAADSE